MFNGPKIAGLWRLREGYDLTGLIAIFGSKLLVGVRVFMNLT